MKFQYNDGGRPRKAKDCVARSVTIATGKPYDEVVAGLTAFIKTERPGKRRSRSNVNSGVHIRTIRRYLDSIGWKWTPTMQIGSGCTVHLREGELPPGRLIVNVSKHITAVIDGVIQDTHDPSREGTRCVYGYWSLTTLKSSSTVQIQMEQKITDAGRSTSAHPEEGNDCAIRAIALARGMSYDEIYEAFQRMGRKQDQDAPKTMWQGYLNCLPGTKRHTFPANAREPRLSLEDFCAQYKKGNFVVEVHRYLIAVVDGVVLDQAPRDKPKKKDCVYVAWELDKT